jgi:putative CocE/NonD family hydrolase
MKDGPRPKFLKKRFAYYVVGPQEWKYADSLEAIPARPQRFYLHSTHGQANDVFHSGMLREEKPGESKPDKYVYDPLDVRPAELEREEVKKYLTDQREALNLFGGGLVYHSEPFKEACEITGYLKLVAWMAIDVPDTDFQVNAYEIMADGTSVLLASDQMRARYRESLLQERLIKPGKINRYEFASFTFFSRQLAKESRLRLVIRAPNSIHWQKNYNSGGVVADETRKDARTAHVTLFHDAERPSYLELPMVK